MKDYSDNCHYLYLDAKGKWKSIKYFLIRIGMLHNQIWNLEDYSGWSTIHSLVVAREETKGIVKNKTLAMAERAQSEEMWRRDLRMSIENLYI